MSGHYAHNCAVMSVYAEGATHNRRVCVKNLAPQTLGNEHGFWPIGLPFRFSEGTPFEWLRSEHAEEIGSDFGGDDTQRSTFILHHGHIVRITGDTRERVRLIANVEVVEPRNSGVGASDIDEPIRIGIGKRLQKNTPDNREHSGIGADAKSQSDNREDGHFRRVPQQAHGVAKILEYRVHG